MLKQIPTAHPAIMFGYLAVLSGIVFYELRWPSAVRPEISFAVITAVGLVGGFVCEASRKRRAKALREKYSERRPTRSGLVFWGVDSD